MTLHVTTITPKHIVSVSDRLIATSSGFKELDRDRYKHLTLLTPDARVLITFAGFAGVADSNKNIKETILDHITQTLGATSSRGKHQVLTHLLSIKENTEKYISKLHNQGLQWADLRLAIAVWGVVGTKEYGPVQYSCLIDNCLSNKFNWLNKASSSFRMRHKFFIQNAFERGCQIFFLGNDLLARRQRALIRLLKKHAKMEETKKMFETSVRIIRAVQPQSNGTVGYNCSGIRITKDDPGIEVYDDREYTEWEVVMPNCVRSFPDISVTVSNMKGKKGL
jgi:hypothetical protein